MKLWVVAVGQRVPDWAQAAWDDYAKRFPPELKVELKAVKTEPRSSKTLDTIYAAERERIEAAIPRGCRIVALDERGTHLVEMAEPCGIGSTRACIGLHRHLRRLSWLAHGAGVLWRGLHAPLRLRARDS
jgi:hypothetical protein